MKNIQFGWTLGLAFFFAILLVAGCGPKGPAVADVSGSVTWKGKPLTTGIVTMYSPTTGKGTDCALGAEGTFTLRNVEVGSYTVSIVPPIPAISENEKPPKPQAPFLLPEKYQDGQTSGLAFDVKADGENKLTLELK